MSSRQRKSVPVHTDKDIYLFLVEADGPKGINEDYEFMINKLLAEKIFAERVDEVCVREVDSVKNLHFDVVTWDTLRTFVKDASNYVQKPSTNLITSILDGCKAISAQARKNIYSSKKVLCFGNFNESKISEAEIRKLKTVVDAEEVLLTIVFPKEVGDMSSMQEKNYNLLSSVLEDSESIFIFTYQKCLGRILNRNVNKSKRSVPWKVVFEIGSNITIPVKRLLINRKNASSFKTEKAEGTEKETLWTSNDGTAIDESDISTAYVYGDQIVSTGEESSHTGEPACLKLLVFCPRENIQPSYLVGDGTDIFLAQDDDQGSDVKVDALVKVLHKANKVAVVRKVWNKASAARLGVLVPDLDRKGLIYTDLCFADDISTPHFPPLIKDTSAGADGVTENDLLIDELIKLKSIPEFLPEEGPVDPAELIVRQHVTNKLVYTSEVDSSKGKIKKPYDSLELFFEDVILSKDFVDKFKGAFPLIPAQTRETDRPSGLQVFRKRGGNDEDSKNEGKKVKLDEIVDETVSDALEEEEPVDDMDNLMNDL